jgi:hypothetical protein
VFEELEPSHVAEPYGLPREQAAVLSSVDALAHAIGEPDSG